MKYETWYLLLGGLMLAITFLDRLVKRLPITTTIIYLFLGIALGPLGFGVIGLDPVAHSPLLERFTEVAVIISLFTAGLKLRAPLNDSCWKVPIRLASVSMLITISLIAGFAVFLLDLPVGAAILLGAILAPTDPVLASDVQIERPGDRDQLRFSLTAEAGLNDGTAFPFVMLGLGALGLHDLGTMGWRWVLIDLLWAVTAGLGLGAILGTMVGRFIVRLRRKHKETVGRDEFIALGLVAFSYGLGVTIHAYGFLSVFAAGLALRQVELEDATSSQGAESNLSSVDPARQDPADLSHAPQRMAGAVLGANEQLERILEIGLVLIIGAMLSTQYLSWSTLSLAPVIFLFIRPLAVFFGSRKPDQSTLQRMLAGWFGIRGIGSLYYLMYAIQKGLPAPIARELSALVLSTVAASILIHGFSVTPAMNFYQDRRNKRRRVPVDGAPSNPR